MVQITGAYVSSIQKAKKLIVFFAVLQVLADSSKDTMVFNRLFWF